MSSDYSVNWTVFTYCVFEFTNSGGNDVLTKF